MKAAFWDFVAERHRIWDRRFVEELVPPWTTDPILRDFHFTNVYRELDPGTQYVVRRANQNWDAPSEEHVLNTLLYRCCLTEKGAELVGWLGFRGGSAQRFVEAVGSEGFWLNAYFIHPYGEGPRAEGMARMLQDWIEQRAVLLACTRADEPAEFCEMVQALPGVGAFLAYQTCVDLSYPSVRLLEYGNDLWTLPGPGARKGAGLLLGKERASLKEAQQLVHQLREEEDIELGKRDFPWWYGGENESGSLTMADLQNCLCEFYKYVALQSDGKRPMIRRYRGGNG